MGVHGLWKLIEPSGQMVPLESLAGKVLAVDVSIWLHQAVKGMHDASGAPVAVAHLLILFHRICKLLFYKIKPVFVFDGGVPALKHQTMAARRQHTGVAKSEAMKVREKLIKNLLKHEAVRQVLSNETASAALGLNSFALPGPSVEEDLYKLPPIAAADYVDSESEEVTSEDEIDDQHIQDIHSIDVTSKEFLNLPPEIRHDVLTELIETRKQSSWKHLDEMPKQSDNFSDFQMNRLLKRRAVQTSLEKAGKEMGGKALSLKELESMLGDQGILDPKTDLPSRRIAQDSVTHYMLVQNTKTGESEKKEFDIMTRLEDVEYSSESDTDVILRKPERKVEVKKEPNVPKVRMTAEIANILSVLEDDEADDEFKMKVKELQSRINIEKTIKVEPEEETKNETESILMQLVDDGEEELKKAIKSEPVEDETEKESILMQLNDEAVPELRKSPTITQEETETIEKLDYLDEDATAVVQTHEDMVVPNDHEVISKIDHPDKNLVPENGSNIEPKKEDKVVSSQIEPQPEVVSSQAEPHSAIVPSQIEPEPTKISSEVETEPKTTVLSSEVEPKSTVVSSQVEPEPENRSIEKPEVLEKIAEMSDSSSDTENDFCDVAVDEPKHNGKSDSSVTVTINPAEITDKDDIFADVFDTVPEEEKEREKGLEKDNIDRINEYKDEFQKEMSKGGFTDLKKILEDQQENLMKEKGRQERLALNPTDQMYSDAQELLRLFGIPFIIAPMEAEAQCATLNTIGLTEGTITDDSDIWLFGGRVVYKNFFNQNKHVLEYRSEDIQKYFKLSREDMIKMAMLVGSDYTIGLNGIGPVTAMEILAAFQSASQDLLDSLYKFRDWFTGRTKMGPPRATLKKKIRNTIISPGFPNKAVAEAYLNPQVDDSKEPFSWAKPNLDMIQKYAKLKMGWSSEKCNELLLPVLKKLEENSCQNIIERYFKIVQKTSPTEGVISKRVEKAIQRLGGSIEEEIEEEPKPKRKRKPKQPPQPSETEETEENPQPKRKRKTKTNPEPKDIPEGEVQVTKKSRKNSDATTSKPNFDDETKTRIINQKLHQDVKIPQREMALKLKEEQKKKAAEIFRTYKKGKKNKVKVFAKEEAKLSESSSDDE